MAWIAKIYHLFWSDLFTLAGGGVIGIALMTIWQTAKNDPTPAGNSRRVIFLELFVDLQAIS